MRAREGSLGSPIFCIPYLDVCAPSLAVEPSSTLTNTAATSVSHVSVSLFDLISPFPLLVCHNENKKNEDK